MTNWKTGEQRAAYLLRQNGFTITDVSQCPDYFDQDVDLIAYKDGKTYLIEVKWDSRISSTGNLFYEVLSDECLNKVGWGLYTKCDYLFYGDAIKGIFYVINTSSLREFIEDNELSLSTARAKDKNKESIGILIPISKIIGTPICRVLGGTNDREI